MPSYDYDLNENISSSKLLPHNYNGKEVRRLIFFIALLLLLIVSVLYYLESGIRCLYEGNDGVCEKENVIQVVPQKKNIAISDPKEIVVNDIVEEETVRSDEIESVPLKLSPQELEQLKVDDYHSYVKYKAGKSSVQDGNRTKEELKSRIRKKIIQHLKSKDVEDKSAK